MDKWLIENTSNGATLCILLGDISKERLKQSLDHYSKGVLWITKNRQRLNANSHNLICLELDDPKNPTTSFSERLTNFIAQDYGCLPDIKSTSHSDAWIISILDLLMLQFDSTIRARKTRNEDGFMRQNNVFENLCHYLKRRIPDAWENQGKARLGIVVGAGPSLDITLPIISRWEIPYNIIATDSAIQALYNTDLSPDFVVSIDPAKSKESCTSSNQSPGILIASNTTHPSWINSWKDKSAFISGPILCEDWLEQKKIFPKAKVNAINNVGLTAIALADFLAFEVIILVGMDLGTDMKSGKNRYAEITDRPQSLVPYGTKSYRIPGNFSSNVETSFLSDWKDTSDFCKKICQNRQIINLNDRGAQIEGCIVIHSDSAIELHETLKAFITDSVDADELCNDMSYSEENFDTVFTALASACDRSWKHIRLAEKNPTLQNQFLCLRNLMTDPDFPTIIGDYSFAIMPVLLSKDATQLSQLKEFIDNIKLLLWKLEDSLIQLPISTHLMQRFLTSSFS